MIKKAEQERGEIIKSCSAQILLNVRLFQIHISFSKGLAEDVQASLDAGMNAHLSKPIVIDEVIKTILRYVYN